VWSCGASKKRKASRAASSSQTPPKKVGDRVLFGKYSGNDIKIDDEEFMILKEDEILAKLAPNAKAAGGKK
jgi:co-chaperonin GroES (HSP10)